MSGMPRLGDSERNGQPNATATGNSVAGASDENGVGLPRCGAGLGLLGSRLRILLPPTDPGRLSMERTGLKMTKQH